MAEENNEQAGELDPNPSLTHCRALYKSLNLSEPQCSHPQNRSFNKIISVLPIFIHSLIQ